MPLDETQKHTAAGIARELFGLVAEVEDGELKLRLAEEGEQPLCSEKRRHIARIYARGGDDRSVAEALSQWP